MTELLIKKIDELGFAKYPQIIDDKQIENFLASLSELRISSTVREKKGATYGGRLSSTEIRNLRKANKAEICCIKRGEAFLMRPLVVHSSSAGTNPKHRRVIHIEFSAEVLPDGLEWYGS